MIDLGKVKKYALISGGVILLCAITIGAKIFFNFVGDPLRADEIYQQALKDFDAQNYSNAYFQFSKVSYLSDLKPYAIYHRAECARILNDYKSENKQYYLLFNVYQKNELSLRAKYLYAVDISESNPRLAQKFFEEIIKKYPETDYALGAKYQLAVLLNAKYTESAAFGFVDKKEIENLLRDYLIGAPSGRWALKCAELWQNLNSDISAENRNLIAETYFAYNLLSKAEQTLEDTDLNVTWEKKAKLAILNGEPGKAKSLIETGLRQKNSKVTEDDRRQIISRFLQTQKDKQKAVDDFFKATSKPNDIYLKMLQCRYASTKNHICYANILRSWAYTILNLSHKVSTRLWSPTGWAKFTKRPVTTMMPTNTSKT